MFLIILIKSLIIGALVGVGVGRWGCIACFTRTTGDGRVPYVGRTQLCEGDPASHFLDWVSSLTPGVVCGGRIVHPDVVITHYPIQSALMIKTVTLRDAAK